jgi:hypothetical protein
MTSFNDKMIKEMRKVESYIKDLQQFSVKRVSFRAVQFPELFKKHGKTWYHGGIQINLI